MYETDLIAVVPDGAYDAAPLQLHTYYEAYGNERVLITVDDGNLQQVALGSGDGAAGFIQRWNHQFFTGNQLSVEDFDYAKLGVFSSWLLYTSDAADE